MHHWQEQQTDLTRRSIKNSYLRFLRGWGVESSSIEVAVLKGWVESRIGLAPIFYRERIISFECDAYLQYQHDRLCGSERTNAINEQLDLVYIY
ncbi:MAG: hypothetical protein JW841_02550 [Deltaproteobacteria bacterium]|nr:hypothetical protein [Deltaproteobacteria bacterium]